MPIAKLFPAELRLRGHEARDALAGWAARYDSISPGEEDAELFAIGREIFYWLDENGWASAWVQATGPRSLEIRGR